MSDVPYLDFRYGMVSERLRRRSDLSMYSNSAEKIENMVPLRTGGLKQREGLKYKCLCSHTIARVVPLSVSDDKNFLVCFTSDKHIIIYKSMPMNKKMGLSPHFYPLYWCTGITLLHHQL